MAVDIQKRPRLAVRLPSIHLPAPATREHAQRQLPWRWLWTQAVSIWVATRLAYAVLTLYFPLVTGTESPSTKSVALVSVIHRWTYWDGAIYIQLAQNGYWPPEYSVYFPLYPALIRACAAIIGPHWALAALLVSNLGALLAFVGIAALAAQVATVGRERRIARTALILFAAYPLAFFTVAVYTDGIFVGLAAFTLLFALRQRWGWCAAFALLAGLCRPVAPALILPVAWEAVQCFRAARANATIQQALRATAPAALAAAAPAIGIAAFSAYLWQRFGDPLMIVHSEHHWAHFSMSPLLSLPVAVWAFVHVAANSPLQMRILLDLVPVLVGVILTLVAARRAPIVFTLYMLGLLYIITSEPIDFTDLFISSGRYMLAAVPLVVILAGWLERSEWLLPALCCCGAILQAILAVYFLRHGWIV
jgi:hypothetical protein